jgi:predicted dehydrogenase
MRVVGERGALEVAEGQSDSVSFYPAESGIRHDLSYWNGDQSTNGENAFQMQLKDFVTAVKNGTQPKASGEQSVLLATVFEQCYERATALEEPWVDQTIPLFRVALPTDKSAGLPVAS